MTSAQKDQLTEAITDTFMWNFKKGDNIVYNLEIAQELYRARATSADKSKYNKPLLITLVSIIECILDDFSHRIVGHVRDTVPNISQADINTFRTKKYDQLEHYIAAAKRFNLFDQPDSFYDLLDELRKARNRVHIQNSRNQLHPDEHKVFTQPLLAKAEDALETVLNTMITKFPRGTTAIDSPNVALPWKINRPSTV